MALKREVLSCPSFTKCRGRLVGPEFELDYGSFRERSSSKTLEVQTKCEGEPISSEILYYDNDSLVY